MKRHRKRGHVMRLDGPGRIRIKLAKVISNTLGCECDPYDIWQNNYPAAKYQDVCRWGVTCRFPNGIRENVHSWDRMGDCANEGILLVSPDRQGEYEVSRKGNKP